jgi:hypothetical protein
VQVNESLRATVQFLQRLVGEDCPKLMSNRKRLGCSRPLAEIKRADHCTSHGLVRPVTAHKMRYWHQGYLTGCHRCVVLKLYDADAGHGQNIGCSSQHIGVQIFCLSRAALSITIDDDIIPTLVHGPSYNASYCTYWTLVVMEK